MTTPTAALVAQIKHLSASAVNDFLECPLRWYGRRVEKWPEAKSTAMAMGTALHSAIAAHHSGGDAELVLLEAWKFVRALEPPVGALERHLNALGQYVKLVEPESGDTCEFYFRAHLPGMDVPFIGYVDLYRPDSSVWEFKSGASKWDQAKVDLHLQATGYWALHELEVKAPPSRIQFVALQTGPYRPVEVTMLETRRTDADVTAFVETVKAAYQGMQAGNYQAKCKAGRCLFPEQCSAYVAERSEAGVTAKVPAPREKEPEPVGTPRLRLSR